MTMFVADVGNTRIKWAMCSDRRVEHAVALPDDPDAWRAQLQQWKVDGARRWIIAGVHPERRDRFAAWMSRQGHHAEVIRDVEQVPIVLNLDPPITVGIDRVLGVFAAKSMVPEGTPAAVVDCGTAVTVNLLDEAGAFAGGAIFPGFRLMAESLHDNTAQLPHVDARTCMKVVPARATIPAIAAGVYWAVIGGIGTLIRSMSMSVPTLNPLDVFVTGGDAEIVEPDLPDRHLYRYHVNPRLTLEGLRLAAVGLQTSS